jgi:hypothetical protein
MRSQSSLTDNTKPRALIHSGRLSLVFQPVRASFLQKPICDLRESGHWVSSAITGFDHQVLSAELALPEGAATTPKISEMVS